MVFLFKSILNKKLLMLIGCLVIVGCNVQPQQKPYSTVMVISIASNGNYAVTSDTRKRLILWDISRKTAKIIANNVNIYSAYFIKGTDNFMFQNDTTNQVIIENITGKMMKSFNPGFATYGQAITKNLQHYFASDEEWNLYYRADNKQQRIAQGFLSFVGIGKLLNLTISTDEEYLLLSGDGDDAYEKVSLSQPNGKINLNGVVLWDLQSIKPIYKFYGNQAKTIATLNPEGKYIVSGDENNSVLVWSTQTGKKILELWDIWVGKLISENKYGEAVKYDATGMIQPPKDFDDGMHTGYPVFALKFIDNDHYLRFPTYIPYAILYNVHDPKPLKYFPLGTDPYPMINEYSADEAIDTAPAAHILVMGQSAKGSGIIVYRYDPEKQTLTKIWAPPGPA